MPPSWSNRRRSSTRKRRACGRSTWRSPVRRSGWRWCTPGRCPTACGSSTSVGEVIRPARAEDWAAIWPIWHAVVAAGDTYVWAPSTTETEAQALWMLPPPAEVLVVDDERDGIVATATLKPNQIGLG